MIEAIPSRGEVAYREVAYREVACREVAYREVACLVELLPSCYCRRATIVVLPLSCCRHLAAVPSPSCCRHRATSALPTAPALT